MCLLIKWLVKRYRPIIPSKSLNLVKYNFKRVKSHEKWNVLLIKRSIHYFSLHLYVLWIIRFDHSCIILCFQFTNKTYVNYSITHKWIIQNQNVIYMYSNYIFKETNAYIIERVNMSPYGTTIYNLYTLSHRYLFRRNISCEIYVSKITSPRYSYKW